MSVRVDQHKYTMRISRLTVDKLGVKLYDRASAVLAELVANSYDADAAVVEIIAPMGEFLATRLGGEVIDKGREIVVRDNGHGMTPEEVNDFYLEVGAERRQDPRRGDTSTRFGRKVMGRKGVGKLAPFGICERIELLTSGGERVKGVNADGDSAVGYLTAHLFLDRGKILENTTEVYPPDIGPQDGIVRARPGTTLTLSGFGYRSVPSIEDLSRQLAQRFGIERPDWKIVLIDSLKAPGNTGYSSEVGHFVVPMMPTTTLRFDGERVRDATNVIRDDIESGVRNEERFYPITGWIGYAKEPYRDDLMAGIRIYCRGKIAAQSAIFNRKAGFTGEFDVRSYLVGELHADWLDEDEDLIQTDRRDILWSHELGRAFEAWGQSVVVKIGRSSRTPMKATTWATFRERSGLEEKVDQAFPGVDQKPIRDQALELAKMIGQTMRGDEVTDQEQLDNIVNLSLVLAPHLTLDNSLRQAAEAKDSPLGVVTGILRTARIAELSSFGRIAEDRVKIIGRVEEYKLDESLRESVYQELLEQAPWLIDPQWTPITMNQAFSTLRREFQNYYREKTGKDLDLAPFSDPKKQADFVLSNQDQVLHIIEIKRPGHDFEDAEMTRLDRYKTQMENFLKEPTNQQFAHLFSNFHMTLVCDGERLTGVSKTAFDGLISTGRLTHMSWATFLLRTRKMHEQFLEEADRQKLNVAQAWAEGTAEGYEDEG